MSDDLSAMPSLLEEVDALCARRGIGFDDFLEQLASAFRGQAQRDPTERALMDRCADHLDSAGMDFYASTK